ncbi:MAG TPA: MSMEG_0565 family glycosyltransferase [Roseiflexaceae bacterium]
MARTDRAGALLRIAMFTYSTKPRGGVIHTLALADQLQALGHSVHVFALGKGQSGFFRPTAAATTLIPTSVPDDVDLDERIHQYIESYYAFLRDRSDTPFDIYHVQDCISANAVWRIREESRIPSFVRTIHHIDDFVSPSLIECQNNSIYRPNHRIVVSRHWQQRLLDEYGVDSEIIHNGVDLWRYQPPQAGQRAAARARLGLGDEFVFLNIGGIEPRKNTIRLLGAFERVKRALELRGRGSVLLLAGGETLLDHRSYRDEFFARLGQSPLRPDQDIRALGPVPDDMVTDLYHAADALAFPSVKEGWGLVVLEAMASELPVLASDLPVFREYLRSEENALLVDPLDEAAIAVGMLRLTADGQLRRRLAAAGPPTARQFSWAAAARAHVEWYRRWLDGVGARD